MLGASGRLSQSGRADRMGDLGNYEACRLEQDGGDKGEAEDLSCRSSWEFVERRNTEGSWDWNS